MTNLALTAPGLQFRTAVPADAACVADLLIASRGAFIPYAPIAHTPEEVIAWVEHVLIPSDHVVLACRSSTLAGVLAFSEAEGTGWINQLYVAPGHAGQGIGTALLTYALARLTRPVQLHTFQANAGARRFYERHGFVPVMFSDGRNNEEQCPDVLYELPATSSAVIR